MKYAGIVAIVLLLAFLLAGGTACADLLAACSTTT